MALPMKSTASENDEARRACAQDDPADADPVIRDLDPAWRTLLYIRALDILAGLWLMYTALRLMRLGRKLRR